MHLKEGILGERQSFPIAKRQKNLWQPRDIRTASQQQLSGRALPTQTQIHGSHLALATPGLLRTFSLPSPVILGFSSYGLSIILTPRGDQGVINANPGLTLLTETDSRNRLCVRGHGGVKARSEMVGEGCKGAREPAVGAGWWISAATAQPFVSLLALTQ